MVTQAQLFLSHFLSMTVFGIPVNLIPVRASTGNGGLLNSEEISPLIQPHQR